jgi:adenylate cyclase
VFGSLAAMGWVVSFMISIVMDLLLVRFGSTTEAIAYYGSSAVAMLSTGLFGFLVTYLTVEYTNRRYLIPRAFPDGGVSHNRSVRPVTLTQRLLLMWFGVSFFPLMVLALGIYTQRYLPENEARAVLFAVLFMPVSLFLVRRVGRSMEQPLHRLVTATESISTGDFDIQLQSQENDDLGYLTDETVSMARSLAEKERMRDLFGRVVDPRVRDVLMSGALDTAGARRSAAIMFCDIRGFTTFSEKHREDEVVRILNEHLTAMERVVQKHGGMINKFLGDGFLALFGLPLEREDPAGDAYRCARDLVRANQDLNTRRRARGDQALKIGVGVHYGELVVGAIGSDSRSEYTVIGDAVNLTSRIEGLTKRLGTPIVVTDALVQAAGGPGPELEDIGMQQIRGRTETVRVWAVRK